MSTEQFTLWVSALLAEQHSLFFREISAIIASKRIKLKRLEGTNDIWCRDYLPVSDGRGGFVQFRFDPSYLKYKKYSHLRTDPSPLHEQIGIKPVTSELVLDGGNAVRSEKTVVLTDFVLRDNPEWSEEEIRRELSDKLNVEKVVIIPHQPYDFTGHSDGMVRLPGNDRVLINDYSNDSPRYRKRLIDILRDADLHPETFPYGMNYDSHDTQSAVGTYINSLEVGKFILFPLFGIKEDELALKAIRQFYPSHEVLPVNSRSIADEGGVLNCIGWVVTSSDTASHLNITPRINRVLLEKTCF